MNLPKPPKESWEEYARRLEQENHKLKTINQEEKAMLQTELDALKATVKVKDEFTRRVTQERDGFKEKLNLQILAMLTDKAKGE